MAARAEVADVAIAIDGEDLRVGVDQPGRGRGGGGAEDDFQALNNTSLGYSTPDAARRAGDDRDFALKFFHVDSSSLPLVIHPGNAA